MDSVRDDDGSSGDDGVTDKANDGDDDRLVCGGVCAGGATAAVDMEVA